MIAANFAAVSALALFSTGAVSEALPGRTSWFANNNREDAFMVLPSRLGPQARQSRAVHSLFLQPVPSPEFGPAIAPVSDACAMPR
jgi:hypothetical protein